MATDSPASWGAVALDQGPSAWGAVSVDAPAPASVPQAKKSFLTVSGSLDKLNQGFMTAAGRDEDFAALKQAPIGGTFQWQGKPAVKLSDTDFEVTPTGEVPASSPVGAALRAAGVELPGAGAGAAAFGAAASNPFVRSLPPAGRVGIPLVAGMVGGVTGSMASRGVIEATMPELANQLRQDETTQPIASLIGANVAQAPFFRVGGGARLLERGLGASIGAGIQGGTELANDAPLDQDALIRMAIAGAGGAAFTDPTKLGQATMQAGAKLNKPITSQLGNASTKSNVLQANEAANAIAMEPAAPPVPQPDPMGLALQEKALADMPAVAGAPEATQGLDLGYFEEPVRRKPQMAKEPRVRGIFADEAPPTPFQREIMDLAGQAEIPPVPARDTVLAELAASGEAMPPVQPLASAAPRKTQAGDEGALMGNDSFSLKETLSFDDIAPSPERQMAEQASFNQRVLKTTLNLANEGVEIDRQTAVKLARLTNPNEFNAARQQLIDSVKLKVPEVPETGPIKSLADLPAKVGQDDAITPETAQDVVPEVSIEPVKTSDYDRYTAIQKQWGDLIKQGKGEGPEVNKLWAENEEIKNRHGGMPPPKPKDIKPSSSAMGIVPPEDPSVALTRRGVDKANDKLTEMMAKADTEATSQASPSVFDEYIGIARAPATADPEVTFPKPGEGRSQSKSELKALKEVSYEDDLLRTTDSITGKPIPENIKRNAETIYARLKKEAADAGSETPPREAAEVINQVPEQYKPFFTDIASRWSLFNVPGPKQVSNAIGVAARFIKNRIGLIEDNIGDVYKPMTGAIREMDHFIGNLTNRFAAETAEFGKLTRKHLTKQEYKEVKKAALTGSEERIRALLKGKPEEAKMVAALDRYLEATKVMRQMSIEAGRDVGDVGTYFNRIPVDREKLAKATGRDTPSAYSDALKQAQKEKGGKLTEAEKDKLFNQLLSGTNKQGGPSFTKARSIDEITDDIVDLYEDLDVAASVLSSQVARDVANRKWFGRIDAPKDGESILGEGSSFGQVLRKGVESGAVRERGQKIILDNMKDLFGSYKREEEGLAKVARGLRRAQTYAYLSDISSAAVQFADVFSIMREYGPKGLFNAYGRNMPKISDIGVAEGHNQDVAEFSKKGRSLWSKTAEVPFRWAMRNLIGKADEFQKSATLRAATAAVSKAIKDPSSNIYKKLDKEYSAMYPDKWPEIKKSLESDDFAKGKLDDASKFFLFNELVRLQPVTSAGRAQGFNSASGLGKMFYALRSYWLKQLGIIRNQAYNEMKTGNFLKGAAAMGTYLAIVAVGQQSFQKIKDTLQGKGEIPFEDYAIGGMLQLGGVPRYALYRAGQTGLGTAALETAMPGTGVINDLGKDIGLTIAGLSGQRKADTSQKVRDMPEYLQNLESTKYIPAVGREAYALFGKGKLKEDAERARVNRGGEPRPSAAEQIWNIFDPEDLGKR